LSGNNLGVGHFQEAEEAEELLKAIQAKRGPNALATMAAHRRKEMSSFISDLEEKYASSGKGGAGKKKGKVGRSCRRPNSGWGSAVV
jgi:hypothetical protein